MCIYSFAYFQCIWLRTKYVTTNRNGTKQLQSTLYYILHYIIRYIMHYSH